MKTANSLSRYVMVAGVALVAAGLVATPGSALAGGNGAASQLKPLKKVQTVEDLQSVDAGDKIVMSCPKCKDTYVTKVEKTFKGMNREELKTTQIHLCPTCETKITTEGQGKAAKDKVVHTCRAYQLAAQEGDTIQAQEIASRVLEDGLDIAKDAQAR